MKSQDSPARQNGPGDEEKAFADYLRQHPDFFQRHPSLLSHLVIPHPTSGQAVSLLERQVIALREQQNSSQKKLRDLVRNARENDRLNHRMEELTLYLLGRHSLDDLLDDLPRKLKKIFDLEYAVLRFESESDSELLDDDGADAECLSNLGDARRRQLFGEDAEQIESCALLRLRRASDAHCHALLAIGSSDTKRYHPDSGTHFLQQLQRLLSASINQLDSLAKP